MIDITHKTRMTTFIKTKFNKSDDQTNIDNIKYLQNNRISINLPKFIEEGNNFMYKMYVKCQNQQV